MLGAMRIGNVRELGRLRDAHCLSSIRGRLGNIGSSSEPVNGAVAENTDILAST